MNEPGPYGSGPAVESAIRDAARRSATRERDVSRLIRETVFDRFLCRVFAAGDGRFVLKGGTGMLARIPTARTTRDVDLATEQHTVAEAASALVAAVALDLGDHFRFLHLDTRKVLTGRGQPLVDGVHLRFDTYLGAAKKEGIGVDLVRGHALTADPIRLTPANRIALPRLQTHDYLLYPLVDQIADKVCACESLYGPGGTPSTRVKDLVDLVLIARTQIVDGTALVRAVRAGRAHRLLPEREVFTPPVAPGRSWRTVAALGNLPSDLDLSRAVTIVSRMLEPVLTGEAAGLTWLPAEQRWR